MKGGRRSDEGQLKMSLPSCFVRLSTHKRLSHSWLQKNAGKDNNINTTALL